MRTSDDQKNIQKIQVCDFRPNWACALSKMLSNPRIKMIFESVHTVSFFYENRNTLL